VTSTGIVGSSAHESRTFDCPWCGAISPVPADHLGEHFACPECRKETKLTEKNTSALGVTETPPDAPHLTGDRTFDCPWCGAISAVPSSHLGERFACPECKRDTKLTPTNTRRAPITAPPPDAPPPEPTGAPKGLLVVAGLIVVGVAAWLLTAGGSSDKDADKDKEGTDATVALMPVRDDAAPPGTSSSPKKTPEASPPSTAPTPVPATPTALPPEPTPTNLPPPPPAPERPEAAPVDEKALADRELSEASRAVATAAETALALDRTLAQLVAADPELAVATSRAGALDAALGEVPPPAAGAHADAIRAYDAAVAKALGKSPAGVEAAEALRARMAAEAHGRGVAGLGWQDLDFHGDAFRRAAAAQREAWAGVLARLPKDRVQARDDALKNLAAAKTRLERAQARRDALGK
jgi:predicted RNA-binding Zn-ribbon protein involved in translation (DUF1610 family)